MYLVTVFEEDSFCEASLGGNVTADEIEVFGEQLTKMLSGFQGQPYNLLLDYSKAKALDRAASLKLADVKDECIGIGAVKIVSVPSDEHELVRHTSIRMQAVLEGYEEFVAEAGKARFKAIKAKNISAAA